MKHFDRFTSSDLEQQFNLNSLEGEKHSLVGLLFGLKPEVRDKQTQLCFYGSQAKQFGHHSDKASCLHMCPGCW